MIRKCGWIQHGYDTISVWRHPGDSYIYEQSLIIKLNETQTTRLLLLLSPSSFPRKAHTSLLAGRLDVVLPYPELYPWNICFVMHAWELSPIHSSRFRRRSPSFVSSTAVSQRRNKEWARHSAQQGATEGGKKLVQHFGVTVSYQHS